MARSAISQTDKACFVSLNIILTNSFSRLCKFSSTFCVSFCFYTESICPVFILKHDVKWEYKLDFHPKIKLVCLSPLTRWAKWGWQRPSLTNLCWNSSEPSSQWGHVLRLQCSSLQSLVSARTLLSQFIENHLILSNQVLHLAPLISKSLACL